ncbi:MAG: D-alanine--D-alanine ligase [Treponema sp.]|jgi:D-alanine-D-alanine ligase|nr:D-alanine--D-alanine ligase [Treponema sp.]
MINKKLNVGILCGGKSAEHEVSLQSARNIFEAIDRERFNPILIGIDKSGAWFYGSHTKAEDFIDHVDDPAKISLSSNSNEVLLRIASSGQLSMPEDPARLIHLDVIFPILHGPFGEDGTVQGLLKLADIPFVGSGVLGSAAGMDKDVMKRLLRDSSIPIGKFLVFREWEAVPAFKDIMAILGNPVFVKPANMGSSVGVSKVPDEESFMAAVNEAFKYDTKIILEENIPGREIECSVLGNEDPQASLPGEVKAAREFYSYEAKYIDADGAVLEIPAKLGDEKIREIQSLAMRTFQVLECSGLSRVDFFLKEDGSVLVNEINTMPGFTKISMYPKLWEKSGIGYTELITRLIELAIAKFEKEKKLKTTYG